MSTFSFDAYQKAVEAAKNRQPSEDSGRVGWFKLEDDGYEALVRINLSSVSDMQFATIHKLGASTNWMKVSCVDEFGSREKICPLCAASLNNSSSIGKATKRVYIPMLASYKDPTTGQWSAPQAVIWERPAGFSREIANKLKDYGDLRQVMFKITRNGQKRQTNTTYSVEYAMPTVFRPEMIPTDFSAFNNFKVDKHSFWVKTVDEINTFLATGSFPIREHSQQNNSQIGNTPAQASQQQFYAPPANAQPAVSQQNVGYNTPVQQVNTPPQQPYNSSGYSQPQESVNTSAEPVKPFSGFSF